MHDSKIVARATKTSPLPIQFDTTEDQISLSLSLSLDTSSILPPRSSPVFLGRNVVTVWNFYQNQAESHVPGVYIINEREGEALGEFHSTKLH